MASGVPKSKLASQGSLKPFYPHHRHSPTQSKRSLGAVVSVFYSMLDGYSPILNILNMPFTSATASVAGEKSGLIRRASPKSHIEKMQEKLMAFVLDDETEPQKAAQCACAWEKLEERKRILNGDPLPGSLRPEAVKKSRQSSTSGPLESIPEEKPEV